MDSDVSTQFSAPRSRQRRRSPQQTREQLLAAGLRILAADPAEHAFDHLKAARVAAAAGRTQGAFFHHWATQDDYVFDLIDYAFAPERSTTLAVVERSLVDDLMAGRSLSESVIRASAAALAAMPADPQTVIEFLIWKRAVSDAQFGAWLLQRYRSLDQVHASLFVTLLGLVARRPRPPFTAETLTMAIPALVQAVSMRELLDDDVRPLQLTSSVVLAVLPLLTAAPDDDRDAPQYLAWLARETGLEPAD